MKLLVSLDRVMDASSIKVEINETTFVDAILHDYESELNLAVISINIANISFKLMKLVKKCYFASNKKEPLAPRTLSYYYASISIKSLATISSASVAS